MISYTIFQVIKSGCSNSTPSFFILCPFCVIGGKDKKMKIYLYYEDKNKKTYLDVPEDECTVMIQTDYEKRLHEAEDGEEVMPRTVQEILDEEINKPTFNNNQTETRRHSYIEDMDPDDKHFDDGTDILSDYIQRESFEELYRAIKQLEPKQQELLKKVFFVGIKQVDIAKSEGVKKASIESRLHTIYKKIRKYMTE